MRDKDKMNLYKDKWILGDLNHNVRACLSIMGKGCHRQDENMSFSPLFVKSFVDLLDRSQIVMWITLCKIIYIAFNLLSCFLQHDVCLVFHAVKNKAIPNN